MSIFKSLPTLAMTLVLVACGGGGSGFGTEPGQDPTDPTDPGTPPAAVVSEVTVLASSPTLQSDNSQTLDISVIVQDENNVAMTGVTAVISADSGFLIATDPVTDASGIARATLSTGGNPTNRAITVSAVAGGITGSVTVNVVGTQLALTGPGALAQNDSAKYTAVLTDAAGEGVQGRTVEVTSSTGNTLDATTLTTDVSGKVEVNLTATAAGDDTLTATALGVTAERTISVSDDNFVLSVDATPNAQDVIEIPLNTATDVTLHWDIGGANQANQQITFSPTRGAITPTTAMTNASGDATVSIQSSSAGGSVIEATNSAGTSTQATVEFVATAPATIEVQATPFTIGPNEQASITAIVRDAANNLVKNAIVVFQLQDVTGGQLTVASAATNSQGRASTFYNSSSTTSANNGVRVDAFVQSNQAATDFVRLTVAQRELFISLGTGNTISEPTEAQYRKEFVVQVTDSQGNGVDAVTVQVGILSEFYHKGYYTFVDPAWSPTTTATCADEDVNRDGVLDLATEDTNGSGKIEAGNIATVAAQDSGGGTFVTDQNGFGAIDVFYPQDHGNWVSVALTATTSVQGTEFEKTARFRLPVAAADVDSETEDPPGIVSPFGQSNDCLDTD